jgi:hypothetical protein
MFLHRVPYQWWYENKKKGIIFERTENISILQISGNLKFLEMDPIIS